MKLFYAILLLFLLPQSLQATAAMRPRILFDTQSKFYSDAVAISKMPHSKNKLKHSEGLESVLADSEHTEDALDALKLFNATISTDSPQTSQTGLAERATRSRLHASSSAPPITSDLQKFTEFSEKLFTSIEAMATEMKVSLKLEKTKNIKNKIKNKTPLTTKQNTLASLDFFDVEASRARPIPLPGYHKTAPDVGVAAYTAFRTSPKKRERPHWATCLSCMDMNGIGKLEYNEELNQLKKAFWDVVEHSIRGKKPKKFDKVKERFDAENFRQPMRDTEGLPEDDVLSGTISLPSTIGETSVSALKREYEEFGQDIMKALADNSSQILGTPIQLDRNKKFSQKDLKTVLTTTWNSFSGQPLYLANAGTDGSIRPLSFHELTDATKQYSLGEAFTCITCVRIAGSRASDTLSRVELEENFWKLVEQATKAEISKEEVDFVRKRLNLEHLAPLRKPRMLTSPGELSSQVPPVAMALSSPAPAASSSSSAATRVPPTVPSKKRGAPIAVKPPGGKQARKEKKKGGLTRDSAGSDLDKTMLDEEI